MEKIVDGSFLVISYFVFVLKGIGYGSQLLVDRETFSFEFGVLTYFYIQCFKSTLFLTFFAEKTIYKGLKPDSEMSKFWFAFWRSKVR